jgi:hypothetical protein
MLSLRFFTGAGEERDIYVIITAVERFTCKTPPVSMQILTVLQGWITAGIERSLPPIVLLKYE